MLTVVAICEFAGDAPTSVAAPLASEPSDDTSVPLQRHASDLSSTDTAESGVRSRRRRRPRRGEQAERMERSDEYDDPTDDNAVDGDVDEEEEDERRVTVQFDDKTVVVYVEARSTGDDLMQLMAGKLDIPLDTVRDEYAFFVAFSAKQKGAAVLPHCVRY